MVQLIVALTFIAAVLNGWSFTSKKASNKKKLFLVVEALLVLVLILGTFYANRG